MASRERYAFGPFLLDVPERRLVFDGRDVALAPKAYDLLVALVRRTGHLVSKDELLDLVWPGTHVQDGILSVHISALRKALRDPGATRRYIETVSRAGYRFASDVVRMPAAAEVLPTRWPLGVLPASPAVHELIGRARAHLLTSSRAEIPKAIETFQTAVDLDPTYAPAHAGLALAHCTAAELRLASPADAYAAARTAALRALAMDDACADAQVALGAVLFLSDWNWAGARRSLERALDLDPDHTDGYLLYGRLLEHARRRRRGPCGEAESARAASDISASAVANRLVLLEPAAVRPGHRVGQPGARARSAAPARARVHRRRLSQDMVTQIGTRKSV